MALVVESYSSNSAISSTTVVVTKPTGVAVGDLLLIIGEDGVGTFTCPNFSQAGQWLYDGTGGITDCRVTMLYKIADSSDVSASNYTVTGNTQNLGVVAMLRISGWVSGNPIWYSASGGFAPTTSGTHTVSGLSIPRISQQVMILVGASRDEVNSDYIGNFASYTVTSGDSNPTWTEVVDVAVTTGGTGVGKSSLGVAYATTTTTSTITGFSYSYTEYDTDDSAGAIGVLIVLEQPHNTTSDVSHISVTPTVFSPTITQVNTAPEVSHLDTTPVVNGINTRATAPTQWSSETKPSTTWTSET